MHIEPGFIIHSKIIAADVVALGLIASQAKALFNQPVKIAQSLGAAVLFSVFMSLFFLPVGPSELHLLGAIPIYLLFGFAPTMIGFALGLLLQGTFLMPTDLVHLSVNSLSLMVPLMAMHHFLGRKLNDGINKISYKALIKLDTFFYSGVTLMVGFWLLGESVTNLSAWASFVAAYAPVALGEVMISLGVVTMIRKYRTTALLKPAAQRLGLV